jgi:SAM-dependent methyltransferase
MSDDYFIGVHARELERLKDQHAAWLPETRALWQDAGFGAGDHVVDLGAGPGFAALDIAPSVKRVTAVDKAAHFLEYVQGRAANVDIHCADITRNDDLGGPYDGAFCRWFLAFLINDLDNVLARIHGALKSGGVFAAMEYLNVGAVTSSPPIRGFDAHTNAWIDFYAANGGDTAVGRYLPQRLEQAGFRLRSVRTVGGLSFAGERWWNWWGRLFEDFGDALVDSGFMAREALDHLKSDWAAASHDRHAFIHTPVIAQIVAEKR